MPRSPRTSPRRAPSQKRGEDTVTVLLDATEIVLVRHGFAGTTTNHIAEAAGVSIGTLYHYFPSTEALIEAVVHRMWARELAVFDERAALFTQEPRPPLEDVIRACVEGLVAVMAARIDLYKRWYGEASHLGQLDVGLEMTDRAVSFLEHALTERRDEVRPENIRFAADLVLKTAMAMVRTAARDYPREVTSGELARELSSMLSRYLLRDPR